MIVSPPPGWRVRSATSVVTAAAVEEAAARATEAAAAADAARATLSDRRIALARARDARAAAEREVDRHTAAGSDERAGPPPHGRGAATPG